MRRVVITMLAALAAAGAAAQDDGTGGTVGAAVGYSSQFERPFLALDLLVGLDPSWTLVPNASYVEAGNVHRWSVGAELQWNAPAQKLHPKLLAWAGGGLNVITEDPKGPVDATTRDLVANAVLGVGYDGPASPFVQVRVTLRDPTDVGLSVGVRF
jgi:hypothetical protein